MIRRQKVLLEYIIGLFICIALTLFLGYKLMFFIEPENDYKLYKTKTRSGKEIKWIIDEKNNKVIIENDAEFKYLLENEKVEIIEK